MSIATHIAFADESSHNTGRFRGIGMVSFPATRLDFLLENLWKLEKESQVSEIKWKKIKTAKYRFAALKVIDLVMNEAVNGYLRIDVLIWDTEDSRHNILGRDDNENLRRMYFQLFRNVLHLRWDSKSTWILYPDENSIIHWERIQGKLRTASIYMGLEEEEMSLFQNHREEYELFEDELGVFNVIQILEVDSANTLLAQVADLFVGIGVFSHQQYESYNCWCVKNSAQMQFDFMQIAKVSFTRKEDEHCLVLKYLADKCKREKLGVSLDSTKGLFTRNPAKPINFWLYQPQGDYDKAPLRKR